MSSDGAAAAADGKDAPEVLGHVQVDLMQLVFELEQPGSDKAALQARVLAQVEKAGECRAGSPTARNRKRRHQFCEGEVATQPHT